MMTESPPEPFAVEKGTDFFGEFDPSTVLGWHVRRYESVASTQDIAATLPPWSVAIAREQTAGRGQWQRSFASDPGGLYLSASLPFDGDALLWRGFALAVGWSVVAHLRSRGVAPVRLRWPNDLMIGDRKLGGILVSQGRPDTLCVGLGLNVLNRPWSVDPELEVVACRLVDHAPGEKIDFAFLTATILAAVRLAYLSFSSRGLRGLAPTLNRIWESGRRVRLELAAGAPYPTVIGRFVGILANGDLVLECPEQPRLIVPSHWVKRLHEL